MSKSYDQVKAEKLAEALAVLKITKIKCGKGPMSKLIEQAQAAKDARAHFDKVAPGVRAVQLEILAENEYFIDAHWFPVRAGERVTDPDDSFAIADPIADEYLSKVSARLIERGISKVEDGPEYCPSQAAWFVMANAESAFLAAFAMRTNNPHAINTAAPFFLMNSPELSKILLACFACLPTEGEIQA